MSEPGRQIDLKSLSCPTLIEMPVNFINNEYWTKINYFVLTKNVKFLDFA